MVEYVHIYFWYQWSNVLNKIWKNKTKTKTKTKNKKKKQQIKTKQKKHFGKICESIMGLWALFSFIFIVFPQLNLIIKGAQARLVQADQDWTMPSFTNSTNTIIPKCDKPTDCKLRAV